MKIIEIIHETPERVIQGDSVQQSVEQYLSSVYGSNYKIISYAKMHSKAPDLVAEIDGTEIQFEIKGRANPSAGIKFYEKSVGRGQPDIILDAFAKTYTNGKLTSFSDLVDFLRKKKSTVGFPGDKGVSPSGSIWIPIEDRAVLSKMRTYVMNEMKRNGDNYFAIYNKNDGSVSVFFTGLGSNPLSAPRIPNFVKMEVDTYGGSYKTKMRAGFKIKLAS